MNLPITVRRIRAAGACRPGRRDFVRAYGKKEAMPVSLDEVGTYRNNRISHRVFWAIDNLLTTNDRQRVFDRSRKLMRGDEVVIYKYSLLIAFAEIYSTTTTPRLNSIGDLLLYFGYYRWRG